MTSTHFECINIVFLTTDLFVSDLDLSYYAHCCSIGRLPSRSTWTQYYIITAQQKFMIMLIDSSMLWESHCVKSCLNYKHLLCCQNWFRRILGTCLSYRRNIYTTMVQAAAICMQGMTLVQGKDALTISSLITRAKQNAWDVHFFYFYLMLHCTCALGTFQQAAPHMISIAWRSPVKQMFVCTSSASGYLTLHVHRGHPMMRRVSLNRFTRDMHASMGQSWANRTALLKGYTYTLFVNT